MPIAGAFRFAAFPESLETPRLRLRRPRPGDESLLAESFFASRGENPEPVSQAFALDFGDFAVQHWLRYGFGLFMVAIAHGGSDFEHIGHAGLKYRDCGPGVWGDTSADIELGYAFAPGAQGFGFATEASRAVLSATFRTSTIPVILGRCGRENARSAATLVRCGMTEIESVERSRRFEIRRPQT